MNLLNHSSTHHATSVNELRFKMSPMSTLSERIIEAMDSSGVSIPEVAKACECSYQAVKKWRTSETMSLDGNNLVALGELTGYECKWLMTGQGPKHREYAKNQSQTLALQAMEKLPPEEQYKIPAFVNLLAKPDGKSRQQ